MKPSLLFITGWAYGPEAVRPLADALAGEYETAIMTGAEALAARRIPSADFIVAGSMGGLLALELLPPTCKRLVLVSSTARFCAAEGYACGVPERALRRMIAQLKRDPAAVLEEFYRNVHYPHPAPRTAPGVAQEALVDGLEYLLSSDVREKVPQIGIPVLLLHGTEDRIVPSDAAEWLHAHLPDARLRLFEGEGHALAAHRFDEVVAEIASDFRDHGSRPHL